ncbi:MAG: ribonucleoside-diphosphate reductase subunit alpha, partial [Lachnospiraceae bacterium]
VYASCEIAKEKGCYDYFDGSDWQTGEYFEKRRYDSKRWMALKEEVAQFGMRNGYLLAIAPTSSTSMIAGTTAGIDPIMNRYYLEEKKDGLVPRVAPGLSPNTFWYYKSAHQIDQTWSVRACAIRQRHIDQAQSMNLYITNDYTFRGVLHLYVEAWRLGVKTVYYIRSKSLEVEECEVCSS